MSGEASMSGLPARHPRFLGDDVERAVAGPPELPSGWGAVDITYWFTSTVELFADGRVVQDRPNYDIWVPRPRVRIDGGTVAASWSGWWYPLRRGPHDIEVTVPAQPAGVDQAARAVLRVEVADGDRQPLAYRADLRIRKDVTDTTILGWTGTATLKAPR
jgi:hypothetical protein